MVESQAQNFPIPDSLIQNFYPVFHSDFDWENIDNQVTETEKIQLLYKITSSKFFSIHEYESIIHEPEKYHIFDFDNNGLQDVIYAGRMPQGLESDNIAFFQNDGDSLHLVLKFKGTFWSIIPHQKYLVFDILEKPCCSDIRYHFIKYKFLYQNKYKINNLEKLKVNSFDLGYKNINTFESNILNRFYKVSWTSFHEFSVFSHTKKCITIQPTYLTPRAGLPTDTQFDYPQPYFIDYFDFYQSPNKALLLLAKGNDVTIYGQKNTPEGKFYFIEVKNSIPEKSIFQEENIHVLGWVSARDVKIIE